MLISTENQIIEMLLNNLTGSFTPEERHKLLELEYKKDLILQKEEESIHLKSRSIWIEAGDNNAFFSPVCIF